MAAINAKGRAPGKDSAAPKTNKANDRDMSASAQRRRVLEYLRASPQTTYSLRARGISHPAQRIKELIVMGHQIGMSPVSAVDSDGFLHRRVAMYCIEGEHDLVDAREVKDV